MHTTLNYICGSGQLVCSVGNSAQLMVKEGKYVTLRLPSKCEMRMFQLSVMQQSVLVGNGDHNLITSLVSAGRKRHIVSDLQFVCYIYGSVMTPNDHPVLVVVW